MPFKKRRSTQKCSKHSTKLCELHCEKCNFPLCSVCVSSGEHLGHKLVDITLKSLETKKEILRKDLQELVKSIYPKSIETIFNIPVHNMHLIKNSQEISTAIDKHGEDLHREINNMIEKLKSNLIEMNSEYLAVLTTREEQIKYIISEITQSIADLRKLLNSNDINLVASYVSRNAEFRKMPPKFKISLPRFIPHKIK